MKLRLRITAKGAAPATFEHAGPVVRVGRDPSCELALEGAAADTVSRQHARIDLAPAGATLSDAGSRNGTLHNDRPIDGPVRLRAGDRIRLGFTGAELKVLALDLSSGAPSSSRPMLYAAGAAAAAVLAGVVLFLATRTPPAPADTGPAVAQGNEQPAPPKPAPTPAPVPDPAPFQPPPPPVDPPAFEPKALGLYQAPEKWGPSVLLQRRGTGYPWVRLSSGDKVLSDHTLVSLPGYRSTVALTSGVDLTLWGGLPQFSAFPPVYESVVVLNDPGGADADLVLSRGRVHLANNKKAGAARVRVGFFNQTWDVTLPDGRCEVCVELWSLPWKDAPAEVHLFVSGRVSLKAGDLDLDLGDRDHVGWRGPPGGPPQADKGAGLPPWWAEKIDIKDPNIEKARLALAHWGEELAPRKKGESGDTVREPLDTIRTRVEGLSGNDAVGLLFLAALDAVPPLVAFLKDRERSEVRGATVHALRGWLSRGPRHADELARALEGTGFARDKADLVVRLLYFLPEGDRGRKETYRELASLLDHDDLIVRELAVWHLAELTREGRIPRRDAEEIAYDPLADEKKRREAVGRWIKLVEGGPSR